tara:strand:+ start:38862 stop:39284 length:423 start_codon:yes stop_codon:yes gene_type:complete
MPRSSWKNQFYTYESASNLHQKVKHIFSTDPFFKQLQCYQEVPVRDLAPTYLHYLDAVDWYIDEYNIILELHGVQHYKMQSFGSTDSYFNQKKNFHNIQYRDNRKKTALLNAGYSYLEISYKHYDKIDSDFLKQKIFYES